MYLSKRFPRRLLALLLVGIVTLSVLVMIVITNRPRTYTTTPSTNQGKLWRIAYYEGGSFVDYTAHLRAVVNGLAELGWLETITIPEFDPIDNSQLIWDFLATNVESPYLEFVADAYWSANWDEAQRQVNQADAIERLNVTDDLDLIIAMGTWAGQDLANNQHSIPTIVVSTSNALESGIIASTSDSGYDHVHAWIDPTLYLRQARLFHDIIDFKTLGVVYEATPEGRVYANLDVLEVVAQERGFEIISCEAPDIGVTEAEAIQGARRCFEWLGPQVDAVWLSDGHRGTSAAAMPDVLEPLFEHNVATWGVAGSEQVRRGALLSIARENLDALGLWTAEVIARTLNGAKPRDLKQVFELPFHIMLNLETARRIGFEPPPSLVRIADEIYDRIETSDQ